MKQVCWFMVLLAAVWGCSLREYVMQEPKYTWGRIQGLLPEDVILEMSDVYRERSYDPTFFWIRLVRHDSLFIGKLDWMSAQVYEVDTLPGLVDGPQMAGGYEVVWDGKDATGRAVPSGVYLCRLAVGNRVQTNKMTFLK